MSPDLSEMRKRRLKKARAPRQASGGEPFRIGAVNLLILSAMLAAMLVILYKGRGIQYTSFTIGQLSRTTLLADVEFEAVDVSRTELARSAAASRAPAVFRRISEPQLERRIDQVFELLASIPPDSTTNTVALAALDRRLKEISVPVQAIDLFTAIAEKNRTPLRDRLKLSTRRVLHKGIIPESEKASSFQGRAASGSILLVSDIPDLREPRLLADLHTPASAREAILSDISPMVIGSPDILLPLVAPHIVPNLQYDAAETERQRETARRAIPEERRMITAGSPLVEAGRVVTAQDVETLKAYNAELSKGENRADMILRFVGKAALLIVALILSLGTLWILRIPRSRETRPLAMFALLATATVLAGKALVFYANQQSAYSAPALMHMAPFAITPMVLAVLVGSGFALIVGFFTAWAMALVFDSSLMVLSLGLASTLTAVVMARQMHRRSSLFRAGLWLGLMQGGFALMAALISEQTWQGAMQHAGAGFLGGVLVALAASILIPLTETLFNECSDVRLFELSDMGHPLLQRLAMEAPGTYHHSLMVANLAQAAGAEVGANQILLRAAAYYHDIGKLTKPEFFIENVPHRENPHDDLAPTMSVLVIISHVKEGISLALREKLPKPIIDGIQQHHGTSIIRYFFHRACTQKSGTGGAQPNETDYRYPGPRPQTLEMGILLLADTVEAASRSLEKPSPSAVEAFVTDLIDEKVRDGQLDECGMTFQQLARIKRALIFSLNNMVHRRIQYPKDEHTDRQPTERMPDKSAAASSVDTLADATG